MLYGNRVALRALLVAGLVLAGAAGTAQAQGLGTGFLIQFYGLCHNDAPFLGDDFALADVTTPWDLSLSSGVADIGQPNGAIQRLHTDGATDINGFAWFQHRIQAVPGVAMIGTGMWLQGQSEASQGNIGINGQNWSPITAYKDSFVIKAPEGDQTYVNRVTPVKVRLPFRWRVPNTITSDLIRPIGFIGGGNCAGAVDATITLREPASGNAADYSLFVYDYYSISPSNNIVRDWDAYSINQNGVQTDYTRSQVFPEAWVQGYIDVDARIGRVFQVSVSSYGITAANGVVNGPGEYHIGSSLVIQFFEPEAIELLPSHTPIVDAPLTTYARAGSNVQSHLLPGDMNMDGFVDVVDVLVLVSAFGDCFQPTLFTAADLGFTPPYSPTAAWAAMQEQADMYDVRADINLDGTVDVVDQLTMTENFGLEAPLPPLLSQTEWEWLLANP